MSVINLTTHKRHTTTKSRMQNKQTYTTGSNWGYRIHEHKQLDNPPETQHNQIEDEEQTNAHNPFKPGMQDT